MSDWPRVPLGEIFEIARGGSPRPIDAYITDAEDGINWISIADASDSAKYIERTKRRIRPEGASRSRSVVPGDLLLTNSMSFGRPYIMRTTGCIHDGWLVLAKKREGIDQDFFYRLLGSDAVYAAFAKLAAGATVKNLNIELVKGVAVPVPPLSEQRRIAAILDHADALRTKRQEALAQLDGLTQSIFVEMFGDPVENPKGWQKKQLGAICEVASSKRVFVEELVSEGVPFYRGTEVGKLGENQEVSPSLFISAEHYERLKYEAGVPREGDLLLPSICPDGRIFLVENDRPFYFKDGRVLWIKASQGSINSLFLRHQLKQIFAKNYAQIASGTTFAELKIFALKDAEICTPPSDLQEKFARIVLGLNLQRSRSRMSLDELDALFASLQHRAFAGQLS